VSPDAFRRFCLLALCTTYVIGVGLVALHVSVFLAALGVVFGTALTVGLTLEPEDTER
jgi:hypothetical protein